MSEQVQRRDDRRFTREDVQVDLRVAVDDVRDLLAHDPEVLVPYGEDISEAVEGLEAVLAKVGPPHRERQQTAPAAGGGAP